MFSERAGAEICPSRECKKLATQATLHARIVDKTLITLITGTPVTCRTVIRIHEITGIMRTQI